MRVYIDDVMLGMYEHLMTRKNVKEHYNSIVFAVLMHIYTVTSPNGRFGTQHKGVIYEWLG